MTIFLFAAFSILQYTRLLLDYDLYVRVRVIVFMAAPQILREVSTLASVCHTIHNDPWYLATW